MLLLEGNQDFRFQKVKWMPDNAYHLLCYNILGTVLWTLFTHLALKVSL